MHKPVFITGNQYKADKLSKLLGVELEHQKVDLDEIQSLNVEAVVEHKVRQAFELLRQPVLVEDTALEIKSLGGLPGPFIKYFVSHDGGNEMVCRMLDGFSDRTALATSVFGYYDGETMELIRGDYSGTIANNPAGSGGFGWDAVFAPDGYGGKTNAELAQSDYDQVYASIKPLAELKKYLES